MTNEQKLMIKGMYMLLEKFKNFPIDTRVTVFSIIRASNEVYDEILEQENSPATDQSKQDSKQHVNAIYMPILRHRKGFVKHGKIHRNFKRKR